MVYFLKEKVLPWYQTAQKSMLVRKRETKKKNNEHVIHLLIQVNWLIWVMLFMSQRGESRTHVRNHDKPGGATLMFVSCMKCGEFLKASHTLCRYEKS